MNYNGWTPPEFWILVAALVVIGIAFIITFAHAAAQTARDLKEMK